MGFVVGSHVKVDGRGAGMLELDNEDGTWNIGFEDGSEGDIPEEQIVLSVEQHWRPSSSDKDAAALLAARHARHSRDLAEADERTKELLKACWSKGKCMAEIIPRL